MNSEALDAILAEQLESRAPHVGIDAMSRHASAKQAVWWGCSCAWFLWRPTPSADDDASLGIASRWVFDGDEEYRRLAAVRAEQPEAGCCRWLLKAVVNSGGSLAFPERQAAQPTPDIAGKLVAGFLHQLMATSPPIERMQVAQSFVQLARQAIRQSLPMATAISNPLKV